MDRKSSTARPNGCTRHYHAPMPLLASVSMRGAICIAISSWNNSLAAYGMLICDMRVVFLQPRHSMLFFCRLAIAMRPHRSHTCTR